MVGTDDLKHFYRLPLNQSQISAILSMTLKIKGDDESGF
jgi:hypothetical protein